LLGRAGGADADTPNHDQQGTSAVLMAHRTTVIRDALMITDSWHSGGR
jgi:hypothetical protein